MHPIPPTRLFTIIQRLASEWLSRSILETRIPKSGPLPGVRGVSEPTIADAVLDRIVHNAYRIELKGESQRKRNKPPPLDGGGGNRAPA